jgi:signal transduction histidine kinase
MRSLRTKLILGFVSISALGIVLGLVVSAASTFGEFRRFTFSRNQQLLREELAGYYLDHGGWGERMMMPPFQRQGQVPLMAPAMFTVVDADGVVRFGGPGYVPGQRLAPQVYQGAVPVEVDGDVVGWLIVGREAFAQTGSERQFFERLTTTFLLGAGAASVTALLAGALLARSLTRPLVELTAATRAVAAGDFGRKVSVESRDELGQLAHSFNRMSQALETWRQQRRRMTADIAHELRTPLTIILGHLDAIEDGVLQRGDRALEVIRDETNRLARLVEDLRILTRADAGELHLTRRPVDLNDLARQAVEAHRIEARPKNVDLRLESSDGPAPAEVDGDRMLQVLDNLLANALRHSPEGGTVTVGVGGAGQGARLWVRDGGPGIPEDELGRVFERFYRTDQARRREDGGSGLGLAIARSIVEAHGWRIWVESAPGAGSTFLIGAPVEGVS